MVCCLSSRSSTLHLYPRDENYAPEGPQNVSLNLISTSYSFQAPSIPYSKTIKGICRLLSISIRFRLKAWISLPARFFAKIVNFR